MFEHRFHKVDSMIAAVAVLALVMAVTAVAMDVDAAEGESIEYRESSTNNVVIYNSPMVEDMVGETFEATVTDSSGNEYTLLPDETPGVVFFATIGESGCVVTLSGKLSDGLYNVHIYVPHGQDLYNGPLIVGELSLVITGGPMTVGGSATYKDILTATPEEIADNVVWISSNPNVIRITDSGVEAVGVGAATLTATYDYIMGDEVATTEVTVNPIKVTDSGASISGNTSVQVGSSVDLTLAVDSGASEYSVEWTADPAEAVSIVSKGDGIVTVTGEKVTDSVTITATITNYDNTTVSETYILKVEKVPVTGIEITTEGLSLGIGGTTTLKYKFTPENATDKGVTWTSSNTTVATVDEDGKITGLKEGTTTITVISVDNPNAKDTYELTVKVIPVDSVSLDKTTLTMEVGGTEALVATVLPDTAGNKAVTWSSSDDNVVIVSDGVVTAKGLGKATITVTTVDGSKTATCQVEVIPYVFDVDYHIDNGKVKGPESVAPGGTVTFTVTPDPGYKVDSVSVNGEPIVSVDGVYTISDITADVTVTIACVPDVIIPPIDDDDDYVPIPPVIDNSGSDDDTTTIVACAAAAVVAALMAVFLIMEYRKR